MENIAACCWFLSGYMLLSATFTLKKKAGSILLCLVAIMGALAVIFLGLEEVSWFQRAFHIALPGFMRGNGQHEINLHNFNSDVYENIGYFGLVAFIGWSPFLISRRWLREMGLDLFQPASGMVYGASLMASINYDMWNQWPMPLAFFIQLWLLVEVVRSARFGVPWGVPAASIILMVLLQTAYFTWGGGTKSLWELTELREALMAFSALAYGTHVLLCVSQAGSQQAPPDIHAL